MNIRFLWSCGVVASMCAAVSGGGSEEYSNAELPEVREVEALALGARRVKVSESTLVIATQGERLLVEFDRAITGLRSRRSRWPDVMRVNRTSQALLVSSSQAGHKSFSVLWRTIPRLVCSLFSCRVASRC